MEGSTLDDWPITYQDLEPFYTKAEWEIGVSGKAGANTLRAAAQQAVPDAAAAPQYARRTCCFAAARKLGWHPFPIPMAINSVTYQGRPGVHRVPALRGLRLRGQRQELHRRHRDPSRARHKHCQLRTGCVARRIVMDAARPRHRRRVLSGPQLIEQPCRIVVVSCSATETPRLLFNSATNSFPADSATITIGSAAICRDTPTPAPTACSTRRPSTAWGPRARVACCDFNHGLPDGLRAAP